MNQNVLHVIHSSSCPLLTPVRNLHKLLFEGSDGSERQHESAGSDRDGATPSLIASVS